MRGAACWLAACSLAVVSACDGGANAASGEISALDRAIEASGGASNLAAIQSIESRTRGTNVQLDQRYGAIVKTRLPDLYRHDLDASDAHYVQATDGKDVWATLDEYPIPIDAAEVESLRLSWRLGQISALLPLKSIPDLEIRDEGLEGGDRVVQITFPPDPRLPEHHRGPFRLLFDGRTSLLRHIEFETMIFGSERTRPTRIELLDYRAVNGVMIPFAERIYVAGSLECEVEIEEVVINGGIGIESFRRPDPPDDLVIKERVTGEVTVALLEQRGPRPEAAADAEEDLARFVEKHGLVRSGLPFRLQPLSDRELPAVGVPIMPPAAETRPASRPATREQARICVLPSRRVLTTVIPASDPAARSTAIERLIARAASDGLEAAGPCKIVRWSADVCQLQLPVRKKG